MLSRMTLPHGGMLGVGADETVVDHALVETAECGVSKFVSMGGVQFTKQ